VPTASSLFRGAEYRLKILAAYTILGAAWLRYIMFLAPISPRGVIHMSPKPSASAKLGEARAIVGNFGFQQTLLRKSHPIDFRGIYTCKIKWRISIVARNP